MSPEDEAVVDRLKRAIKSLNIALAEASDVGISVELEIRKALAGSPARPVSFEIAANIRKVAFEMKIPNSS